MQIVLNGKPYQATEQHTIAMLVDEMALAGKRYAVEVNEEIVPRSEHADYQLQAGDQVEVVVAIGGG